VERESRFLKIKKIFFSKKGKKNKKVILKKCIPTPLNVENKIFSIMHI
jgi:hypothetical protein